ncbi:plectin-like protein [Achlya hypogyna]|uniref:Plectin-like protein n=1 Tax=Achlya hypogyna TaxID=1202772 RepID=A0A1V9ZG46_ACHHY|nr:plectin-like protein [Achlya hypogyna]
MADEPPPLDAPVAAPETSVMDEMLAAAMHAKAQKAAIKAADDQKRAVSFGQGLKKGFFSAAPRTKATKTPKAKADDIPTIRAKSTRSSLEIPEVQSAMQGLQSKDWMTPEFLDKLSKDPKLCTALQNPRFTAAIQEMSSNPEKAVAKYQNDPGVAAMLKDFMQFMGAHFEQLGKDMEAKELQARQRQALESAAQTPEEQAQVQRILSDPELQAILSDPAMQAVLRACQEPGVLLRHLADPVVGAKIRKLQAAGLVQLHP